MKFSFTRFVLNHLFARVPPVVHEDLSGKHVVVVGANAGIGFEAAKHFASMNPAKLVLACRSAQRGEAALRKLREETGCKTAELWLLDLADFASVKAFATRYEQEGGRLDILVENAAIVPVPGQKVQMTVDGWESVFQTNNLSTSLLGLLLLPRMLETAKKHNTLPRLVVVCSDSTFSNLGMERTLLDSANPLQTFGSEEYCTPKYIQFPYILTLRVLTLACISFYQSLAFTSRITNALHLLVLNILFTRALADRLHNKPLIVNSANPGYCYSELRRDLSGLQAVFSWLMDLVLARTAEEGAPSLVWAALGAKGEEDRLRGQYTYLAEVAEPSDYVISKQGREDQDKLWDNLIDILAGVDPRIRDIVDKQLSSLDVRSY
ncbi:hypothetical protein NLJ89_g8775 [Agrocybe chaxingu]|uniref:NAD(P)-binding protein n=1 Tax=Agrocybe chaxingu TaxID=84603 RepID=A0A9W8JWY8_9AGAR|nr:hypothetical protein NLJ89_g8775 [Agrocybe chaxingu]